MRSTCCFILSVIIALLGANAAAQTVSGTVVMNFDLSGHGHDEEARLWIPYPISDHDQTITHIRVQGTYSSQGVYTDTTYKTPMLYARWDAGGADRKLTFSFDVTRREVIRRDFPARETAWDPADYAFYLAPTKRGPISGSVKELSLAPDCHLVVLRE